MVVVGCVFVVVLDVCLLLILFVDVAVCCSLFAVCGCLMLFVV